MTAQSQCRLLRIVGGDFLNALTSLSASTSLLAGAQARLALTHPSSHALEPLLQPGEPDAVGDMAGTSSGS